MSLLMVGVPKVWKLLSIHILKNFLAFGVCDAVLLEVFVPIAIVPLEVGDIGKNPHVQSVYGILYTVKRFYFLLPTISSCTFRGTTA